MGILWRERGVSESITIRPEGEIESVWPDARRVARALLKIYLRIMCNWIIFLLSFSHLWPRGKKKTSRLFVPSSLFFSFIPFSFFFFSPLRVNIPWRESILYLENVAVAHGLGYKGVELRKGEMPHLPPWWRGPCFQDACWPTDESGRSARAPVGPSRGAGRNRGRKLTKTATTNKERSRGAFLFFHSFFFFFINKKYAQ